MVSTTPLSIAERRRLRGLLAPLGDPADRHVAALTRAVREYREHLDLAAAAPKRKEGLRTLARLEKLTGDLHLALSDLDLDVLARIGDAPGPHRRGPDQLEIEETGRSVLRLHAMVGAARHQLSMEGEAGGRASDDGARVLFSAAARVWREAGVKLTHDTTAPEVPCRPGSGSRARSSRSQGAATPRRPEAA
ncbi:MAG TPA: hypothetical protein VLC53_10200, partial [Myxococcota bacterium]|nr:hypothetical protein [Myxococcota bacterium]